jgi:hypothetical protein
MVIVPYLKGRGHIYRRRPIRSVGVMLLAGFLTLVVVQPLSALSFGRALPPYPVPHGSAVLNSGYLRGFPWIAFLDATSGRPCVEIEIAAEAVELCETPLPIAVATLTTKRKSATRSVIALMGGPGVRRVFLNFYGRPDETVHLNRVSSQQVEASHVSRLLRVAARARSGPFCLKRYVAYGVGGRFLFRSFVHSCG